ncbi:4_t:CDS:1, partial [Acaulospora morrowiae]
TPKSIDLVCWFQEIRNLRTSMAKALKLLLQHRKQVQIQKHRNKTTQPSICKKENDRLISQQKANIYKDGQAAS